MKNEAKTLNKETENGKYVYFRRLIHENAWRRKKELQTGIERSWDKHNTRKKRT